jgi:hypothetical protein
MHQDGAETSGGVAEYVAVGEECALLYIGHVDRYGEVFRSL